MNIDIVVPTMKTEESYFDTSSGKCLRLISDIYENRGDISIKNIIKAENRTGLSELFQDHLNTTRADYVLFIHDDLEIHDQLLVEKLLLAHKTYNIVGLAGATSQDYSNIVNTTGHELPLVWHLRKMKPEDARGIVAHTIPKGFNGVEFSHVNSAYFGPTPSPVVVIDGLFMSFDMGSLHGKDEVFDRSFSFHHYDMGMCLRANGMSLTIGVHPIFTVHHGLGEYANDPTWHKMAELFRNKYGNYKKQI